MKITNISCTQFAGVRDRSVALDDGINVIYGKNESGKSTLVNLLSRTLFQDVKLSKSRKNDKEFRDSFFPAAKKGSSFIADFADGKITFETQKGEYTITKEWGFDSRCMLSTPDGIIRDTDTIVKILREELVYGEGVYTDMLLSSQRNSDIALQTLLDASKKTDSKQEIVDVVSQAFAESDGVSSDAIEQAIYATIDEIAGKHWDSERGIPVRKSGRWASGLGEILKAYYALEDAKEVLEKISQLESEADKASVSYLETDAMVQSCEAAYNNFNFFVGKLTLRSERKKAISRIESELNRISEVVRKWPILVENVEKAKKLDVEITTRKIIDLYESAKILNDELNELKAKEIDMLFPEDSEIKAVKACQRSITLLENKLCGMNLNATIKMLGENQVEIKSLRSGELIDVKDVTNISEAVIINIPGVMEMQLSPADVDVEDIERKLSEKRFEIGDILNKYCVSTLEELELLQSNYFNLQSDIKEKTAKLSTILGSSSFEDIKKEVSLIVDIPRSNSEINADIRALCGSVDISRYIVSNETTLKAYESEYNSIAELKVKVDDLQIEHNEAKAAISACEDIPMEYNSISDPQRHLEKLQNNLKLAQQQREHALQEKTSSATSLENYKESISGDPVVEVEKAKRIFNEQKELLAHWQHIAKVFEKQKESIADNPLEDLAANFTRYLGIISGGKVACEFPETDKLNMNIYSSDRLIDYSKLSEGTKESVSLAFRLAVLDHLFPDGGGLVVLDDPFANMDIERTTQSVELIKDFATRHQVIFLTCKEEYLDILNGNRIVL